MKKTAKKAVSFFLSVLLVLISAAPGASAISYPEGITADKAETAIEKTDTIIYSVLKSTQNTTLKELLTKELYSSSTLSMLLLGVYGMLAESEADLLSMNIDVSVSAVAKALGNYPEVSAELSKYTSWGEIENINADWGVNDRESFSRAVSAAFTPFNDILYALLCSGSFSLNSLVGIKGGNGYETAIIPTLKSFGCKSITDSAVFYADAKADKSAMIYHIVSDLFIWVEDILDSPADRLTDILPGIAYFFENGGFDDAVSKLIEPLTLQLGSITTFIKIEPLLSFIADPSSMTANFDINSMLSSGEFKMAEIDMAELASCGKVSGDTVISNKGDCFVVLLRFIIDTLKLNSDQLDEMTAQMTNGNSEFDLSSALGSLMEKETDDLVSMYISLVTAESGKVNNYQWTFGKFTPTEVTYTQNLGQEKYQRVLDGIDELIDEFVAESSEEKTLEALLGKEIYSSATVTSLISGIYSAFESEELSAVTAMLGLNITPSAVASGLTESKFSSARNSLYGSSSWKNAAAKNINWGFKNGDSKGFAQAIAACLKPIEPMINMLLAGGKISLMGIDFYGSDGYNSAVIPLLEALGCQSKTILTYDEYKMQADKGNSIEPVVNTICSFLNRLIKKPVYTITQIAPNLIYFIENDGISVCIDNLLFPITSLTNELGMGELTDMSQLEDINLNELMTTLTKDMDLGMNLPEADISALGTIGQLKTVQSKRTYNGQPATVSYVEADQTGVLITILRYFVDVMKTPGNENMLTGFMGGGAEGGNDMFATYSSGIGEEMAAMTTDETVEWLYKIFFRERAVKEIKPQEDYLPTIIYEPAIVNTTGRNFVIFVIILCAAEVFLMKKHTRIERYFEDRKLKKKLKDEFDKNGEQEA